MTYVTLPVLRAYIGANADDDDPIIVKCLNAAQQTIDTFCKRTFEAAADTTRYFNALDDVHAGALILDYDLCQITTVLNGDGATVAPSSYVTNPRNSAPYCELHLKLSSNIAWTYGSTPEDAIAVTGRWAFSVTAPADIEDACVRLAKWKYNQRDGATNPNENAIMTASGAVIMSSALPKDVVDILKNYQRLRT